MKLLCANAKKYEILGKSVNFMVPESYKQHHNNGMLKLKRNNDRSLIGNQIDLVPIVTMVQTVLPCSLIFRYSSNIQSELSLITIIKYYRTNNEFVLLDSKDRIELVSNSKFDEHIIKLK